MKEKFHVYGCVLLVLNQKDEIVNVSGNTLLYGYSKDELKGKLFSDLKVQKIDNGELHRRKDGSTITVSVHMIKIAERKVVMICHEEKDYLLSVANTIEIGAMLVDKESKVVHANEIANELFSKNEIIGKTLSELLPSSVKFRQKYAFTLPLNGVYRLRNKEDVLVYSLVFDEYAIVFLEPVGSNETLNRLNFMAYHDELTSLPTRTLLRDRIYQNFSLARRNGEKVAILFLDLDDFKRINDNFSHRHGNLVLQTVAQRMLSTLRESDTISRVGGDEFVIVIRARETKNILRVVRKIREAISQPIELGKEKISVSSSIGISLYPDDGTKAEELIHKADMAMYKAKAKGKGCYAFYDDSLTSAAKEGTRIEHDIQLALQRKEFELYYQPVVSLASKKVIGAEALIRWNHPKRGLVLPNEFIPYIEQGPLIMEVGEWTIEQACQELRTLRDKNIQISISVNTAATHFQQMGFAQLVKQALKRNELSPEDLIIELTERTLMEDSPATKSTISELNFLGVKLSLDDFGTGYSNLKYLATMPVSILKIDMSFIRYILTNPKDAEIVRAMIGLGKSLGILTVAEGVESERQLERLKKYEVDAVQGYYFSPPLKSSEFVDFVSKTNNTL